MWYKKPKATEFHFFCGEVDPNNSLTGKYIRKVRSTLYARLDLTKTLTLRSWFSQFHFYLNSNRKVESKNHFCSTKIQKLWMCQDQKVNIEKQNVTTASHSNPFAFIIIILSPCSHIVIKFLRNNFFLFFQILF